VSTFTVCVKNEMTGEVRLIEVQCVYGPDAQVQALQRLFREEGWRKAVALMPEQVAEA
jgi:UTP:GlnB (protein PII) uridylyltransferase